jgi:hypothetical protein
MTQRCQNKMRPDFVSYGARGISVCEEWKNYPKAFVEWAIWKGWEKGLTIDRENNNGNYEPNNCRFITMKEQSNNRRMFRTNTSGQTGVSYDPSVRGNRHWVAYISENGKQKKIGRYLSKQDAIIARNKFIPTTKAAEKSFEKFIED